MIRKIILQRLRNAEYIQLMTDLLGLVGTAPAATIGTQRTALDAKVQQIDGIFKTDPASGYSDDILALDLERDGYITGLLNITQGFGYHPTASFRDAAGLLARSLEVYGGAGITKQTYNAQSATITNLINDWTNDTELSAAVTLLGLDDWINALNTANDNFKASYMDRTIEQSTQSADTVRALRGEANELWYALRDKVAGYYQVTDGAAPWATIVPQVNALIDQYNDLLASRKKSEDPAVPVTA